MNKKELYGLLDTIPSHIPIALEGQHGVGKSEIVEQYAVEREMNFVCIILSQRTDGDFVGIPVISTNEDGNKYSTFAPPDLFEKFGKDNKPGIIFLDELTDASADIRNAAQELICSRRLNSVRLGNKVRIIAAYNPPGAVEYQTHDIRPQLMSRFLKTTFCVSTMEWTEYMRENKGNKAVISFISKEGNDTFLFPPSKLEMNTSTPCPRTWKYLSDIINSNENFYMNNNLRLIEISSGLVGTDAAVLFAKFIAEEFKIFNAKDIFTGKWKKMDIDFEDIPLLSSATRETAIYKNVLELDKKQRSNLKEFLEKCPNEILSSFIQAYKTFRSSDTNFSPIKELVEDGKLFSLDILMKIIDGENAAIEDSEKKEKKEDTEKKNE